jgi:hypothetical protein
MRALELTWYNETAQHPSSYRRTGHHAEPLVVLFQRENGQSSRVDAEEKTEWPMQSTTTPRVLHPIRGEALPAVRPVSRIGYRTYDCLSG